MAKGKKTGGRDIQPGQVLNPLGRNAEPQDVREARKFNKYELARLINEYLYEDPVKIDKIADYNPRAWDDEEDGDRPRAIDIIVANGVRMAGRGNYLWFELILQRSVGRVPLKENNKEFDNGLLNHIKNLANSPASTKREIDKIIKQRNIIAQEGASNENKS